LSSSVRLNSAHGIELEDRIVELGKVRREVRGVFIPLRLFALMLNWGLVLPSGVLPSGVLPSGLLTES
jgi:hypothetical protein